MKEIIEKLWNEYFSDECAVINTEEEKELIQESIKLHQIENEMLTPNQIEVLERHIEVVYEIQGLFIKKAFFKGCEFAISLLLEMGNLKSKKSII